MLLLELIRALRSIMLVVFVQMDDSGKVRPRVADCRVLDVLHQKQLWRVASMTASGRRRGSDAEREMLPKCRKYILEAHRIEPNR